MNLHWWQHWTGYDGQGIYDIYSGIWPALLSLTVVVTAFLWVKHSRCHIAWCLRSGHYPATDVYGVEHVLCRKHHKHPRHRLGPPRAGDFVWDET
jgi:hypothetical protein